MLIGVVVMMVLVICTRMHAFPSLIISAILIAVLSGNYLLVGTGNEGGNLLSVAISTVTGGFGGTMTSIGIVIGFGCIMGIFLEKSGAAKRMAITILKLVGVKRADVGPALLFPSRSSVTPASSSCPPWQKSSPV